MSIIDAFRLDGKVAVVTGANTGLGQGMSVALAQAGAKVVGVARRSCEDTKKLIEADGGEFAEVISRPFRYVSYRGYCEWCTCSFWKG